MCEQDPKKQFQDLLINVCLTCMSIAALAITYACASM